MLPFSGQSKYPAWEKTCFTFDNFEINCSFTNANNSGSFGAINPLLPTYLGYKSFIKAKSLLLHRYTWQFLIGGHRSFRTSIAFQNMDADLAACLFISVSPVQTLLTPCRGSCNACKNWTLFQMHPSFFSKRVLRMCTKLFH